MHHFSKEPYEGFWGKYSNSYICVYRQCKEKKKIEIFTTSGKAGWIENTSLGSDNSSQEKDVYILLLLRLNPDLEMKISIKLWLHSSVGYSVAPVSRRHGFKPR